MVSGNLIVKGTLCTSRPNIWPTFLRYGITSHLISTTNVCEVTAKKALLNYAIIQDIPFDVGQVIEDAILNNKDAKMNIGHPFLIYGLCKQVEVPLEDNEAWIHPIKAIMVKKDKPSVPRLEEVYDLGNEPFDEDELRAYQSKFRIPIGTQGEVEQSSTQPPPPQPSQEEDPVSPSTTLEDQVQDLTTQLNAYWDKTQEHRVLISQDIDALQDDMHTIMHN